MRRSYWQKRDTRAPWSIEVVFTDGDTGTIRCCTVGDANRIVATLLPQADVAAAIAHPTR